MIVQMFLIVYSCSCCCFAVLTHACMHAWMPTKERMHCNTHAHSHIHHMHLSHMHCWRRGRMHSLIGYCICCEVCGRGRSRTASCMSASGGPTRARASASECCSATELRLRVEWWAVAAHKGDISKSCVSIWWQVSRHCVVEKTLQPGCFFYYLNTWDCCLVASLCMHMSYILGGLAF